VAVIGISGTKNTRSGNHQRVIRGRKDSVNSSSLTCWLSLGGTINWPLFPLGVCGTDDSRYLHSGLRVDNAPDVAITRIRHNQSHTHCIRQSGSRNRIAAPRFAVRRLLWF
jgi:hypothetical protein